MSILTGTKKESSQRKKKPDELLSSVVRETAVPAALELLRSNERFAFPGQKAWAVLLLDVKEIGGLSKRHGRSEAKGSFIGLIESDQIKTLATQEMLREEVFGIIPTAETLERMEEFSMLATANYIWAVFYENNGDPRVDTVCEGNFLQAQEVSSGATSLREILGEPAWERYSSDGASPSGEGGVPSVASAAEAVDVRSEQDADSEQPEADAAEVPDEDDVPDEIEDSADAPDFSDEVPPFGDDEEPPPFDDELTDSDAVSTTEDEDAEQVEPEAEVEAPVEAADDEPVIEHDEMDSGSHDEEDDEDPDALIADMDEVHETVARRFLTEDLDMSIGLDEFETNFSTSVPSVSIEVPADASTWLSDQVNHLTRQANADLEQLHVSHVSKLRSEYVDLMSRHAEQVVRDVAMDRPGGQYRKLNEQAQAEFAAKSDAKDERIRTRQNEIDAEFETAVDRVKAQAALMAESQYRERNKARLDREKLDVIASIETEIENEDTYTRQEILRLRRKDAENRLFLGQNKIIAHLRSRQGDFLDAERELLETWANQIKTLINDNRADDIKRIDALAEQQARVNEVSELKKEHEALVERERGENADRVRRMNEELERARQEAIANIEAREAEWQHKLNLQQEETVSQSNRVTDLLKQMDVMGSTFQKQYDDRVNEFEADKRATKAILDRAEFMQSRWARYMALLITAFGLVVGGVGFILGSLT